MLIAEVIEVRRRTKSNVLLPKSIVARPGQAGDIRWIGTSMNLGQRFTMLVMASICSTQITDLAQWWRQHYFGAPAYRRIARRDDIRWM